MYYWGNAKKMSFLWVPVIVKGMIADSESVLYNNPVNKVYTDEEIRVSCISKASQGWFWFF